MLKKFNAIYDNHLKRLDVGQLDRLILEVSIPIKQFILGVCCEFVKQSSQSGEDEDITVIDKNGNIEMVGVNLIINSGIEIGDSIFILDTVNFRQLIVSGYNDESPSGKYTIELISPPGNLIMTWHWSEGMEPFKIIIKPE